MIGAISSPAWHTLFSTNLYSQFFIPPLDQHLRLPRSSNGGLATKLLCKSVNSQATEIETETKKKTRGGAIDIENLTTWLLKQEQADTIDAELTIVLSSIALACKKIASLLQRSSIINLTGGHGTTNVQGEDQKKLDVVSNEVFCSCLRSSGRTGIIASEEEDVPVAVEETYSGNYVVVFDPIDGSSNIDTALTTGSIFGIYGPDHQCLVAMN